MAKSMSAHMPITQSWLSLSTMSNGDLVRLQVQTFPLRRVINVSPPSNILIKCVHFGTKSVPTNLSASASTIPTSSINQIYQSIKSINQINQSNQSIKSINHRFLIQIGISLSPYKIFFTAISNGWRGSEVLVYFILDSEWPSQQLFQSPFDGMWWLVLWSWLSEWIAALYLWLWNFEVFPLVLDRSVVS